MADDNPAPGDDLRAAITGAIADERAAANAPPEMDQGAAERPETEPAEDARPAREPAREPGTGRFLPGERAAEKPRDGAAARQRPAEAEAAEEDEGAAAERPAPETRAPEHWSAADKAKFEALPAPARTPFLELYQRMESGLTPKLQRGAWLEREYGDLERSVFTAEQRAILAGRGITPAALINGWAEVERGLGSQNRAAQAQIVGRIIHGYGISTDDVNTVLGQLRNPPAGTAGAGGTAPGVSDPALLQRLQALENDAQRLRAERQMASEQEVGGRVAAFVNETDDRGNLKHPYFAQVERRMADLHTLRAAQGEAPLALEELYTIAVNSDDSTREQLLTSQRNAEVRRAADERRTRASNSQRAGVSVSGSPGPGRAPTGEAGQELSLRDQIRRNMNGNQTSGGPGRI